MFYSLIFSCCKLKIIMYFSEFHEAFAADGEDFAGNGTV